MIDILEKNSKDFIRLIYDKKPEYKKLACKKCESENYISIRNNKKKSKVKIAVALDGAFFFYYNFNFEILKSFGAEIIFFSPLKDKLLPSGIKAVYIGGGYPEIYGAALESNYSIKKEIYEFHKNNGIIYGECGGLMYLCKKISYKGKSFDACGIFPFEASLDKGGLSLGYRTVRLKEKTFFGEAGLIIKGHEFHYSKLLPSTAVSDGMQTTYYEADSKSKDLNMTVLENLMVKTVTAIIF